MQDEFLNYLYEKISPLLQHQNLIITGDLGAGKTSLLNKIKKNLALVGINTRKQLDSEGAYLELSYLEEKITIGRKFGCKMLLIDDPFNNKAFDVLKKLYSSTATQVYIDEVGYLESEVEQYMNLLIKLTQKKKCIILARKYPNAIFSRLGEIPDHVVFDIDQYQTLNQR